MDSRLNTDHYNKQTGKITTYQKKDKKVKVPFELTGDVTTWMKDDKNIKLPFEIELELDDEVEILGEALEPCDHYNTTGYILATTDKADTLEPTFVTAASIQAEKNIPLSFKQVKKDEEKPAGSAADNTEAEDSGDEGWNSDKDAKLNRMRGANVSWNWISKALDVTKKEAKDRYRELQSEIQKVNDSHQTLVTTDTNDDNPQWVSQGGDGLFMDTSDIGASSGKPSDGDKTAATKKVSWVADVRANGEAAEQTNETEVKGKAAEQQKANKVDTDTPNQMRWGKLGEFVGLTEDTDTADDGDVWGDDGFAPPENETHENAKDAMEEKARAVKKARTVKKARAEKKAEAEKNTHTDRDVVEKRFRQPGDAPDTCHDQNCSTCIRPSMVLFADGGWTRQECHLLVLLSDQYGPHVDHRWLRIQCDFFNNTRQMIAADTIERKFRADGYVDGDED